MSNHLIYFHFKGSGLFNTPEPNKCWISFFFFFFRLSRQAPEWLLAPPIHKRRLTGHCVYFKKSIFSSLNKGAILIIWTNHSFHFTLTLLRHKTQDKKEKYHLLLSCYPLSSSIINNFFFMPNALGILLSSFLFVPRIHLWSQKRSFLHTHHQCDKNTHSGLTAVTRTTVGMLTGTCCASLEQSKSLSLLLRVKQLKTHNLCVYLKWPTFYSHLKY